MIKYIFFPEYFSIFLDLRRCDFYFVAYYSSSITGTGRDMLLISSVEIVNGETIH